MKSFAVHVLVSGRMRMTSRNVTSKCNPTWIKRNTRRKLSSKENMKGVYFSFCSKNKYKYHDFIKLLNPDIKILKRKGITSSPCERWF